MMWRNVCVLALVLVFVGLAKCNPAIGQEPPGAEVLYASDYDSIQAAINEAEDGQPSHYLILVEEGTYTEQIVLNAAWNIVVRGVRDGPGRPEVTIVCPTPDPASAVGITVRITGDGSGVTLDTLNIEGGDPTNTYTGISIECPVDGEVA